MSEIDEAFARAGGRWVTLGVADLARSRAFYGGVLGLREMQAAPTATIYDCGEMRLMIEARPDHAVVRPGSPVVFKVDDIERARRDLEKRGVWFTEPLAPAGTLGDLDLWTASFLDPDGHPLALMVEVPKGFAP
jgi:catechol 2,3-dioxygenase-like lactoylglutathione lyase family enzyme